MHKNRLIHVEPVQVEYSWISPEAKFTKYHIETLLQFRCYELMFVGEKTGENDVFLPFLFQFYLLFINSYPSALNNSIVQYDSF